MSVFLTIAKVLRNGGHIAHWTKNSCCSYISTYKDIHVPTYQKIRSIPMPLQQVFFHGNNSMKFHDIYDSGVTWHDMRAQTSSNISSKFTVLLLDEVVELIREEGGVDVVVIGVPEEMCYVEYFIVATAISPRHLTSITEMVNKLYKRKKNRIQPFALIEGKRHSADWQCIDIGNMVVHVMLEKTRSMYNLEELWLLGPKYDDELHKAPTTEDIINQISKHGLSLMSMTDDTVKALGNIGLDSPWLKGVHVPEPPQEEKSDCKTRPEDDDAFLV